MRSEVVLPTRRAGGEGGVGGTRRREERGEGGQRIAFRVGTEMVYGVCVYIAVCTPYTDLPIRPDPRVRQPCAWLVYAACLPLEPTYLTAYLRTLSSLCRKRRMQMQLVNLNAKCICTTAART